MELTALQIHVFDDARAVIFVVALSEYDQVLIEDNSTVCSDPLLKNNSCFSEPNARVSTAVQASLQQQAFPRNLDNSFPQQA
jgi:hypothetical protein